MELYKEHRPKTFKQMVGQEAQVKSLLSMVKEQRVPHTMLFIGPSGCGKTTAARILRHKLNCGDQDFAEVNAANANGIDMVRDIQNRVGLKPISGDCRVWLIDECHQLSTQAQNAFLKLLEDTPRHVYFFLATTDPQKLLNTVKTRCTTIEFKSVPKVELEKLVTRTAAKVDVVLEEEVLDKLVECSDGSARRALVLLDAIRSMGSAEDQLQAITHGDGKEEAIRLCQVLLNPKGTWKECAVVLKDIEGEPETLRWMVLGYMKSVLLKGGPLAKRAFNVIDIFRDNFYDSKHAGLVAACYEVFEN